MLQDDKAKAAAEAEKTKAPEAQQQADDLTRQISTILAEQKQIAEQVKAADDAKKKLAEQEKQLREAIVDSERQIYLKQLELQAAELSNSESFVKAGAAAAQAEKELSEAIRKKAEQERLRQLNNDAADAEKSGDFTTAAKKRNEVARIKLGPEMTPEQRRELERESRERLQEGQKKTTAFEQKGQAQDLGQRTGNLANNLGDTGKDLKKAAEQLKDGATPPELDTLLKEMMDLIPEIRAKFAGSDKQVQAVVKEIQILKSQLVNGRTDNS